MSDQPVDPADRAEAISAFAADLRALRLRHESPTLSKIQHDSGISRSVISSALAGRQLPSARTVDRIVLALGEDPAPWVLRRDSIAARGRAASGDGGGGAEEAPSSDVAPSWTARVLGRRTVMIAGVSFVLGLALALSGSCILAGPVSTRARDRGV